MPHQANVVSFLRTFGSTWALMMCGAPTVPFIIAAPFVPSAWGKGLLAALAIICGLVSCYGVWAAERRTRLELLEKLESLNKPSFEAVIHYVYAVYDRRFDRTFVFPLVQLVNTGDGGSILAWKMEIEVLELHLTDLPCAILDDPFIVYKGREIEAEFPRKEMLWERASSLLPKGQVVNGYLAFAIPGDRQRDVIEHSKIKVSFVDHLKHEYVTETDLNGPSPARHLPGALLPFKRPLNEPAVSIIPTNWSVSKSTRF